MHEKLIYMCFLSCLASIPHNGNIPLNFSQLKTPEHLNNGDLLITTICEVIVLHPIAFMLIVIFILTLGIGNKNKLH